MNNTYFACRRRRRRRSLLPTWGALNKLSSSQRNITDLTSLVCSWLHKECAPVTWLYTVAIFSCPLLKYGGKITRLPCHGGRLLCNAVFPVFGHNDLLQSKTRHKQSLHLNSTCPKYRLPNGRGAAGRPQLSIYRDLRSQHISARLLCTDADSLQLWIRPHAQHVGFFFLTRISPILPAPRTLPPPPPPLCSSEDASWSYKMNRM